MFPAAEVELQSLGVTSSVEAMGLETQRCLGVADRGSCERATRRVTSRITAATCAPWMTISHMRSHGQEW